MDLSKEQKRGLLNGVREVERVSIGLGWTLANVLIGVDCAHEELRCQVRAIRAACDRLQSFIPDDTPDPR